MRARTVTTIEEFEAISERRNSCELVRGEVVHLSPGGFRHSRIVVRVAMLLEQWAKETGKGRVLAGEAGIVVATDPATVRGADVLYISYDRLPRGEEPAAFCTVPPELVVEVIGKNQTWADLVEKAGEYLRMGVDRIWIIDPDAGRLHVFHADAEPTPLSEQETLTDDTVLPGFSTPVAAIFTD